MSNLFTLYFYHKRYASNNDYFADNSHYNDNDNDNNDHL